MLKIYNTLTKKKELFLYKNKNIKIYTCGPTVYNYCHIGHARLLIFFDLLINYIKNPTTKIIYIRNITNIDNKIINKAIHNKKTIKYISEFFTNKLYKDITNLNIIEPSFEPKTTTFISEMIKTIKLLYENKYAYQGENNDIYFNVLKNENYGKLSNNKIKSLYDRQKYKKKFSLDFSLWKITNKYDNYSWYTPWGKGRPGWHTECAAMAKYYFKNGMDIHSGGKDLLFPHHENELIQYESLNKNNLSKIWMHVGFIKNNEKKMSKSLKNTILIKNILKNTDEEYLRYFIFSTHYRNDIEYSINNINKTKKALQKLYKTLLPFQNINIKTQNNKNINTLLKTQFLDAINDDFNTPKALSILFSLSKKISKTHYLISNEKYNDIILLKHLGNKLGILKKNPQLFLQTKAMNTLNINLLIKKRLIARKLKKWNIADKIRKTLFKYGIQLEDHKNTTSYIKIN